MLKRSGRLALVALVGLSLAAGSAQAQEKCQGAKLKAAGKEAKCLLGVVAKAVSKADPVNGDKIIACQDKMTAGFVKAESKPPCATTGDAAAINAKVGSHVDQIVAAIGLTPPSKCQSSKLKAAGKAIACYLGADAKSGKDGFPPATPPDYTKCNDKFNSAFVKAELNSDCGGAVGDAAATLAKVVAADDDVACALATGEPCACGSSSPATLNFTTGLGTGNCGDVLNSSGTSILPLGCNNLYTGGGAAAVPPSTVPDYGTTITNTPCCRKKFVSLAAATAGDTGSNRNCSDTNCLYGPPLPITSGASVCVINRVAQPAAGYAYCDAGSVNLNLPLNADVYLTIDTLQKRCDGSSPSPGLGCNVDGDCTPGLCVADASIQPCPICNTSTLVCNGGPNNGMACAPGSLLVSGVQWPTSHDCPPNGAPLGVLPIPYLLTTGTSTKTAVDQPSQVRVFCGFCGDDDNAIFKNPAVACSTDADCAAFVTDCNGDQCVCRQHTPGAFGNQAAKTITETGVAAGAVSTDDAMGTATTLATVFCIPPTFNGVIDGVGDLPGPGAASLQGTVQLIP